MLHTYYYVLIMPVIGTLTNSWNIDATFCNIHHIPPVINKIQPQERKTTLSLTGTEPQDYTCMGFAIRHLSMRPNEVEEKTCLLITLSDGKPDDYDNYRGQYGIEDTRRALVEARRGGIHSYCITIDTEAKDYLHYMYGDASYTVINDVARLPV